MKINKWFGKFNIRLEIRRKRHYHHSMEWNTKTWMKYAMKYGTGFAQVKWDIKKPWEFWKKQK